MESSWKRDVHFTNGELATCIKRLRSLMNDWQKIPAHIGDTNHTLFEHAAWSSFGMRELESVQRNTTRHQYVKGLSVSARRFAILAALFHDSGKSGVGSVTGRLDLRHVQAGEELLLSEKPYVFVSGKRVSSMGTYLKHHCPRVFTNRILRLLAVTSGMHYQMADHNVRDYVTAFRRRLNEAQLSSLKVEQQRDLLQICTAVSAADVLASVPVHPPTVGHGRLLHALESDANDQRRASELASHPKLSPRAPHTAWTRYGYASPLVIQFRDKVLRAFDRKITSP